jgi:cytochrome P450
VGAVPQLLKDPYRFLLDARQRHGDIYTLDLGVTKLVVLNSPRHAQHLLRDNIHSYTKAGPVWDLLRTVIGNGLATSEGDHWLRQRRMLQSGFNRRRMTAIADLMIQAIGEGTASWDATASGTQSLDLVPAFSQVAMRVLLKTMFGEDVKERDLAEMTVAVTYMLEYATWAMLASALPAWLPLPGKRRYARTLHKIDGFVSSMIEERRAAPESSTDLVSMMLAMRDPGSGERMTDREVRDEAFTIFMAGHETTALALTWSIYFLTKHPHVMRAVQEEIQTVLGDAPPSYDKVLQLSLTQRVLHETLRMRPPAFWLPRTALEDDEIDGYRIPKGTNLALLIFGVQHDPRHWPDPETFDPDRFLPEASTGRHPYAWIPFGAGQRLCIGRDFAQLEALLCLAMILRRYSFEVPSGYVARARFLSTLRPRGGIDVVLGKRTSTSPPSSSESRAEAGQP